MEKIREDILARLPKLHPEAPTVGMIPLPEGEFENYLQAQRQKIVVVERRQPKTLNIFERILQNDNTIIIVPSDIAPAERLTEIEQIVTKTNSLILNRHFFGFEMELAQKIISDLQPEKTHLEMKLLGYPELNHEFLTLRRHSTMFPALVILDLHSNSFSLTIEPPTWAHDNAIVGFDPIIPDALEERFADTVEYLTHQAKTERLSRISISTEFGLGTMPDDLREKVHSATRKSHFDQIFRIAEPTKWEINKVTRAEGDPMVVGWKEATKQMFLIGLYNPTPLEEVVAKLAQK